MMEVVSTFESSLGGVMVGVLAIRLKVPGFKPGTTSFRGEVNVEFPCSKIFRNVKKII
jgi:hypothetical protein